MNDAGQTPNTVAVTGAAGFVGRRLIRALAAKGARVVAIARQAPPPDLPAEVVWVRADLRAPQAYEAALAGVECVLHLAAVTGKAPPAAYQANNVEATRRLLEASERAGVRRFVLLSSIAVRFADRPHYPYADSKVAAEALVRASPLTGVIVRPTMILGAGSPIQGSLERLARLPVTPLFGSGEKRVQPVEVDDVVRLLEGLALDPTIGEAEIEVGGADTYSLKTLLARLRAVQGRPGAPKFLPLPLAPVRAVLAILGGPLLSLLPLTAGQLATFANDGVADRHPLVDRLLPDPRSSPTGPSTAPSEGAPPSPRPPSDEDLAQEFRDNVRHLTGAQPTPYQTEKYVAFHRDRGLAPRDRLDGLLLALARAGGPGLMLADSYSGLFHRTSVVRQKLVLTLAILEASPPSYARLDAPSGGGLAGGLASMTFSVAAAGLALVVATVLLTPAKLVLGAFGPRNA